MDAFGLSGTVVHEQQARLLHQNGNPALGVAVFHLAGCADDLLRRDAIDLFGIDPHEILAAARDDVGPVAIGAQMLHGFEHRLIDQFRVGAVPAGMPRSCQPVPHFRRKLIDRHAGQRRSGNYFEVLQRQPGHCRLVAGENGLEGLHLRQLLLGLHHCGDSIEAVGQLGVDRLLHPQRPILVEAGDAGFGRHEMGARLIGRFPHEIEDRPLGRAVVPRSEGVGRGLRLRLRGQAGRQGPGDRQRRHAREQGAAADDCSISIAGYDTTSSIQECRCQKQGGGRFA